MTENPGKSTNVTCAKCGITSKEDSSVMFHRFPLPSKKHGPLRAKVWAKFCFTNGDWTSEEYLKSLYAQHKMLCSKHFDESSYTSSDRKRMNKFSIPTEAEGILAQLREEQVKSSGDGLKVEDSTVQKKIEVLNTQNKMAFDVAGTSQSSISKESTVEMETELQNNETQNKMDFAVNKSSIAKDITQENHLKFNSDDDDDNTYTEVEYREQESTPEETKSRINNTDTIKNAINSKKIKEYPKEEEEETELDIFIKYVRCLLKKPTPDMFIKVQFDILKVVSGGLAADKVAAQDSSGATSSILSNIASNSMGNVIKIGEIGTENVCNGSVKLLDTTNNISTNKNDIWNYFEDEGKTARCSVRREILRDTSYDNLKEHSTTQHPKLLLHFKQEQDSTKENHLKLNSDDDNTFTEVEYLEQEPTPEEPRMKKPRITNTYSLKKYRKEEEEDETELDLFIKYVRCLLIKLTPDMFIKVQFDILKVVSDGLAADKVAEQDTSGAMS